eukprot:3281181-Prorocentrum_lima.AAC.1
MTSSLVGSEMCIRDRAINAFGPGQQLSRCLNDPLLLQPAIPTLNFKQPVSYTHLTLPTICSV